MGYTQFVAWVGKQGLKIPGLQKYLYKAWKEAEKVGTPIVEKNFPHLLTKAKDFYKNFKTFDPKVVPKTKTKWQDIPIGPKSSKRTYSFHSKGKGPKPGETAKVIPFPKKPPGKADGGRIDKALPTRSRDI